MKSAGDPPARRSSAGAITEEDLVHVPEPVQRYLRKIGIAGKDRIRTCRFHQRGFMRLKEGQKWLPFTAEQSVTTDPPGFVWNARVRYAPLMSVSVVDKFADGHGLLQAKLLSLFKMARASGREVDRGEALRYLGETAWYPTAWLSPNIRWDAIDSRVVKSALQLPDLSVPALLHFEDDLLRGVSARRHMGMGGSFVLQDWLGQFDDYRTVDGMLIPHQATVKWRLASGDFEYFRAEISNFIHAY